MKIKVFYPSGTNFSLSGEWKGPGNINGSQFILIISDGVPFPIETPVILDPRGVYQNEETRETLYSPRNYTDGMEQWILDWLKEHPEWPEILEL